MTGRCRGHRRAAGLVAAVAVGAGPTTVSAQTATVPNGQIFKVEPLADGLGALALTGGALLLDRNKKRWSKLDPCQGLLRAPTAAEKEAYDRMPPTGGVCDSAEVPAIDRWVLSSPIWTPAASVSDILLWSLVASPLVFSGVDTAAAGVTAARLGDDTAVTFQALGATYLSTMLLKMLVARPRPLTYDPSFDKSVRFAGSARLSFPSGHAALSFSSASILAVMLTERFGDHPAAVAGAAAGYVTAGTVATLRVLGRKHFPTDVAAGAVLGTVVGLTIPLLHTKSRGSGPRRLGAGRPVPAVLRVGGAF